LRGNCLAMVYCPGMSKSESHDLLACPSSRADSPQSAVFGIVDNRGDFPIIRYLERPVPATREVLALTQGEDPNQVFRFTSPCQESRCAHFVNGACRLPRLLEDHLPASESKPLPCPIRNTCRWFHQESFAACARCSLVVTSQYAVADGQLIHPLVESGPTNTPSTSETQSS
jgi:hypothetical protein